MAIKEGTCPVCKETVPVDIKTGKTLPHHRGVKEIVKCPGSRKVAE